MPDYLSYPFNLRPIVGVFASPGLLPAVLSENLLASSFRVRIFSDQVRQWKSQTPYLRFSKGFEIFSIPSPDEYKEVDYVIYIPSEIGEDEEKTLLKKAVSLARANSAKILFVLPFISPIAFQLIRESINQKEDIFGIVYVADVVGPRMQLSEGGLVARMLKDAVLGGPVRIPSKEVLLYPTFSQHLAKELIKSLFSFGPSKETVAIFSRKITSTDFFALLKEISPNLTFTYEEAEVRNIAKVDKEIILDTNLQIAIKETLDFFRKFDSLALRKQTAGNKRKVVLQRKWFAVGLLGLAGFLSAPIFLLLFSFFSLTYGIGLIQKGDFSWGRVSLSFSRLNANVAKRALLVYSQLPALGKSYGQLEEASELVSDSVDIALRATSAVESGGVLAGHVFGEKSFSVSDQSQKIAVELDEIYEELGFLQGEVSDAGQITKRLSANLLKDTDLVSIREKILHLKEIVSQLPSILAEGESRTYLILFQNNMELRPTGGFIGSFALITVSSGRIAQMNVLDVYSADGQLKGHIEPPAPIKNYLGEANWYLRDSNWDPDFPTSAARAEWFLDKELDKKVDGVIALDLEVARKILTEIGPIAIADFNQEIDHKNLYEITQKEVEEDFFPGSYKKAHFLTALSRQLLNEIASLKKEKYLPVFRAIFSSLEEKHIQAFLHNNKAQRALSGLNWEGAVAYPVCGGNCMADWLGVIEANIGVNKANYFIERKMDLSVYIEDGVVHKNLTITYINRADPEAGLSGRYKVYTRVLVPLESEFEGQAEIEEIRGRKEAGVLIEIPPKTEKVVAFSWKTKSKLNFAEKGEYLFYWRKQAGTGEDKTNIAFYFPKGVKLSHQPGSFLTEGSSIRYNLSLARDLISRFSW